MRTFLATMASVAVLSTSAMAADLGHNPSTKDYGYDGVATNHTGFYFGAGAGYGTSVTSIEGAQTVDYQHGVASTEGAYSWSDPVNVFSGSAGADLGGKGGIGALQIGYDRQVGQNFLIGVFADYSFSNISGAAHLSMQGEANHYDDVAFRGELNIESGWTVGARTGVVYKETLFYVFGGYGQTRWTIDGVSEVGLKTSGDADTWVAGGGVETKIAPGLFLGVEGRARFLNSENIYNVTEYDGNVATTGCGSAGAQSWCNTTHTSVDIDPTVYTGMVTLKYKLGSQ